MCTPAYYVIDGLGRIRFTGVGDEAELGPSGRDIHPAKQVGPAGVRVQRIETRWFDVTAEHFSEAITGRLARAHFMRSGCDRAPLPHREGGGGTPIGGSAASPHPCHGQEKRICLLHRTFDEAGTIRQHSRQGGLAPHRKRALPPLASTGG